MRICIACGDAFIRPRIYCEDDFYCNHCLEVERHRAKRDDKPQRLAQSVALTLTPSQFFYLRDAVKRDLENLEEMAPWDIDDHTEEHERETRLCRSMIAMLAKVEQAQVVPH